MDWLISLVFVPLGLAAASPVAAEFGVQWTLVIAAAVAALAKLVPLTLPSIRRVQNRPPHTALAASPCQRNGICTTDNSRVS